ncbi:MAG: DNA repair protein RecN [Vescimonas sp.]
MLELLHIENIAIIDRADITFEPGFNALTGETGAGKSIVIDSLSAVLGQRTSRDLIRTGADKAYVSACFTGIPPEVGEDLGITWDEELLLQREIHADGKNVCRVGSRPVTVTQLRTLGSRLLNIHGQHDGQQLLDEEQHLLYLDSFGRTEPLLTAYREKYAKLTDIRRQMHALQMDEAEKARRMDTLRYQIQELQRAKLRPGEEEELTSRRNLLRNGEKFMSAVSEADFCLSGDDSTSGALALLRQAQSALEPIRRLDDSFEELYQRLEAVYSEVYDLAYTVQDKRDAFDFSPQELDEVEGRLDQLYRLKKKYGPDVESMLAYLDRAPRSWTPSRTPATPCCICSSWRRRPCLLPNLRRRSFPRPAIRRQSGWRSRSSRSFANWIWAASASPSTSSPSPCRSPVWTPCASLCLPTWARSCALSRRSPPAVSWPASCWP